MATNFVDFDTSGAVQIELQEVNEGSPYSADLAQALQIISATVTVAVEQIPAEQRPQEVNLSCGLKAVPSGGFAVSRSTTSAHFTVSLTWRATSKQEGVGESLAPSEAPAESEVPI